MSGGSLKMLLLLTTLFDIIIVANSKIGRNLKWQSAISVEKVKFSGFRFPILIDALTEDISRTS